MTGHAGDGPGEVGDHDTGRASQRDGATSDDPRTQLLTALPRVLATSYAGILALAAVPSLLGGSDLTLLVLLTAPWSIAVGYVAAGLGVSGLAGVVGVLFGALVNAAVAAWVGRLARSWLRR